MLSGELACFTRPEMHVERVSYPMMTPSAARGALEAIFWKPEFEWEVRSIDVCAPVRWVQFRRNEVTAVKQAALVAAGDRLVVEEHREQRFTLALRDVRYVIKADVVPKEGVGEPAAKWRDQFRRRVRKGQCFSQPFLGCREFAARFEEPTSEFPPISLDEDLGKMFWGWDYAAAEDPERADPLWFDAKVEAGTLSVPTLSSVRAEGIST